MPSHVIDDQLGILADSHVTAITDDIECMVPASDIRSLMTRMECDIERYPGGDECRWHGCHIHKGSQW